MRGPNDRIHVIASRYVQLDGTGAVLVDEAQGDGRQGALDFPPAIAVAADGSVHIVTRHGGDFANGHDIRYRRRNPQGVWDRDYWVGTPAKRNYGDDSIHPGAIEICNGVDDDCDGQTDEGCGAPDGGPGAGPGVGGAGGGLGGGTGGGMGGGGEPSSNGGGLASQETVNGGLYEHCGCRLPARGPEHRGGYWLAVFLGQWRRRRRCES